MGYILHFGGFHQEPLRVLLTVPTSEAKDFDEGDIGLAGGAGDDWTMDPANRTNAKEDETCEDECRERPGVSMVF